jgi:hypothetical protein
LAFIHSINLLAVLWSVKKKSSPSFTCDTMRALEAVPADRAYRSIWR